MIAVLNQIERLLERAFETPSRRLFRTRLQPVELARVLSRAMAAEGQVGAEGLRVPNRYVVELHPQDFHRFEGAQQSLERDLATYLLQQVQRRGWWCPGWPEVELRPADTARPGRPQVLATTVARPIGAEALPPALDGTSVLPAAPPRRPAPSAPPPHRAWLELADGRRVALAAPATRIGRARDNDLVLEDDTVSRHHAEVRRDGDRLLLVDLGSTNGTRVNGQSVQQERLAPGATIHVGAVPLRLRVGR
ncbi:MAG TPA: DUF3662 and FHA domain-containing protein [Chloroflexota bacterium]|nr:DUF3662 and FHA domain-containing protein [Chloroflexota bacterium]